MRLTCVKVKKKPIRDLNGILDSQYCWRNEQQLHRLPFHTFRNCLELFLCFRYFYSFDINSVATRFTNGELYVFTPRFLRNITRGFSRKTSFQTSSTNSPCRQQKQHLRLVPHLTPTQQLKTLSRWSRVFLPRADLINAFSIMQSAQQPNSARSRTFKAIELGTIKIFLTDRSSHSPSAVNDKRKTLFFFFSFLPSAVNSLLFLILSDKEFHFIFLPQFFSSFFLRDFTSAEITTKKNGTNVKRKDFKISINRWGRVA